MRVVAPKFKFAHKAFNLISTTITGDFTWSLNVDDLSAKLEEYLEDSLSSFDLDSVLVNMNSEEYTVAFTADEDDVVNIFNAINDALSKLDGLVFPKLKVGVTFHKADVQ